MSTETAPREAAGRQAVIAALAALLALTAACAPAEEVAGPPTPTAGDQATQTPTAGGEATPSPTPGTTAPRDDATPTPTATEPRDPGRVAVALDAGGRVVVLDAATGEEIRELLDGVPVDDPASNDLAVTPDGSSVFVAVPPVDASGESEIVRVPVEGGEAETVARGSMPAVAPDGGTLAYVSFEEPADGAAALPEPVLVLRDLDSGDETRLSREEPFHFIPDVDWTADGSRVVFTAGEIYTGLYAVERDAGSLDEARRLGPELEDEADTLSWGPVAALDQGRLAVVETCCDVPRDERWHVVAVEVPGGTTEGGLLGERVEATDLDSDADAERLLVVVRGGPDGGELLRWDGDGDPERIADGVVAAAW